MKKMLFNLKCNSLHFRLCQLTMIRLYDIALETVASHSLLECFNFKIRVADEVNTRLFDHIQHCISQVTLKILFCTFPKISK